MKAALVFAAVIISAQGSNVGRVGGWGPTGWPATEPPPQGWGSHTTDVELDGNIAGLAAGWAASHHAESLSATGDDNVPADVGMLSIGDAAVEQQGSAIQLTNNDGQVAFGLNAISLSQDATASEGISAVITGLSANLDQSGWSGTSGSAAAASAEGTTNLSHS